MTTVSLRQLRVSAEMDASGYQSGAKIIADSSKTAGAAAGQLGEAVQQAGVSVTETTTKISRSVSEFERLKRSSIEGYAANMKLQTSLDGVSRGLAQGAFTAIEAQRSIDGLIARYGQLGNAGAFVARGQTEMAQAVERANTRLQSAQASAQRAAHEMANLNRVAANMNQPRGGMDAANIGYQFQDIGVTAAMGMSPMMIAMQQGTQLSSVLGPMGAAGAVRGLGGAFMSLLSPVTLVTVGLVGLTAAAIQYFTSTKDGADKGADLINKQNDAIRAAAQAWGSATPALQAYVEQLDRADKLKLGREATSALVTQAFSGLPDRMTGLTNTFTQATRSLDQTPIGFDSLRELNSSYANLSKRVADSSVTMSDLDRVQRALSDAMSTSATPQLKTFADKWGDVTFAIRQASEEARRAREEFLKSVSGGLTVQDIVQNSQTRVGDKIYPTSVFTPDNPPIPTRRPNIELEGGDETIAEKQLALLRQQAGARADIVSQVQAKQSLLQGQNDELEKLRLEASLIGASVEQRARATAALAAEQQLRQQGISLLSREGQAYVANAQAMASARAEIERQNAAYSSLQTAGGSAIDALTVGTGSLRDRLKSAADTMLQWVQQLAIANPIKNAVYGEAFTFEILEERDVA